MTILGCSNVACWTITKSKTIARNVAKSLVVRSFASILSFGIIFIANVTFRGNGCSWFGNISSIWFIFVCFVVFFRLLLIFIFFGSFSFYFSCLLFVFFCRRMSLIRNHLFMKFVLWVHWLLCLCLSLALHCGNGTSFWLQLVELGKISFLFVYFVPCWLNQQTIATIQTNIDLLFLLLDLKLVLEAIIVPQTL